MSNIPRETISIETPIGKHQVVLNSYMTGREKRGLNALFLRDVVVQENAKISGVKGSIVEEAENYAFKTMVISINGRKEGDVNEADGKAFSIIEAILDMHASDYAFIVEKVNDITRDAEFDKKKVS